MVGSNHSSKEAIKILGKRLLWLIDRWLPSALRVAAMILPVDLLGPPFYVTEGHM